MQVAPIFALSILVACGGRGGTDSGFAGGEQSGPASGAAGTSGSSSAVEGPAEMSSSSGSSSSSMGDGDTVTWDMGVPDFGPPSQPAGCEGRIDFLFVISAESSMKSSQEKLLAAFPDFIATIEEQLAGFDVHILVANPNPKPGWVMGDCGLCMEDCDPLAEPPICGAELDICDKKIGAGVTYPAGEDASNRRCPVAEGRRYIRSGDPDIAGTFACMAQAGTGGASRAGQAMAAAVQPVFNDPAEADACNAGFLRDDALLVVMILKDSYDQTSAGTPEEWIEALRSAKHYDDDAFAVLVLTTDIDAGPVHLCHPDWGDYSRNPNRLRLLVEGVVHGFIGSLCIDSFGEFFAEKVSYLVDLCDDFVPPG